MKEIVASEWLKYKRSFTRKLIVGAPLFFVLMSLGVRVLLPTSEKAEWNVLLAVIYNWWPFLFIPVGTALFAGLIQLQEKKAGDYRNLRMHGVPAYRIWLGKLIVMAIHSFMATAVLMLMAVLSGMLTASGAIPWGNIITGGLLLWLVTLPLIPLQLWVALHAGFLASVGLGIVACFVGVDAASTARWIYVPWSWGVRLMCPVVGVHPNGVMLAPGDPLWNSAVIPQGIVVSLLSGAVLAAVTAWSFNRRRGRA